MARLIAEEGALEGREYPIEPGLTLGREGHNQVPMPENRKSSRDHAKVWRESPGKYTVADLGSTNGTLVNDERVTRKPLRDGDVLRLGEQVFRFVLDDAERPAKKEAPGASLADVLSGKAKPTAASDSGGSAAGGGTPAMTVKSRVLQYSKKAGGGSLATWDVSQSGGTQRWLMLLAALAVAAVLFFVVRGLVTG
jgi:pSer/pThr/pTyr-binding forkhead associated (FHA) protein